MTAPLFEIAIERPPPGSRDAARLVYVQLRAAILDRRLPPGALLPATRRAPTFFGVSRNTAIEIYERLQNDGLVVARQGSGTRVVDLVAANVAPASMRIGGGAADDRLNPVWLGENMRSSIGYWGTDADTADFGGPPPRALEFRPAIVDPVLFPQAIFRRLVAQQIRSIERSSPSYRSAFGNQGNRRLRTAVAGHIAVTRAVVCSPDDVLITAGAQQAFDVLARSLVTERGMTIAVEDPGYPPMRSVFAAAGARLVAVPVDAEGLVVDRLPAAAKVICLSPSHQFPLGMSMSTDRRKALIAYARRVGAVIVEDDYDGEFRHGGAALRALISEDAADVVCYVGTFSKCMSPALRLGFLIGPAWAMPTMVTVKNCLDWHCPTVLQGATAAFIDGGHLARHVRRMRRIYGERRAQLMVALEGSLAKWLDPIASSYGMHVAATARGMLDTEKVAAALARQNIRLHALSRYYIDRADRAGFVFGLGTSSTEDIAMLTDQIGLVLERSGL